MKVNRWVPGVQIRSLTVEHCKSNFRDTPLAYPDIKVLVEQYDAENIAVDANEYHP